MLSRTSLHMLLARQAICSLPSHIQ
jgi:hypothetical protein